MHDRYFNVTLPYHCLISAVVGPVVTVDSTTSTSIQISWTNSCPEVDEFVITWERDTTKKCCDIKMFTEIIINHYTSLYITGMEEDSHYIITVTANTNGGTISSSVMGMTAEAGKEHIV